MVTPPLRRPLQTGPDCSPETPKYKGLAPSQHTAESYAPSNADDETPRPRPRCLLEAIFIYPIKSCAPQRAGAPPPPPSHRGLSSLHSVPPVAGVAGKGCSGGGGGGSCSQEVGGRGRPVGRASWPLGPFGLAYDREWAVVDHRDRALRLKQVKATLVVRDVDILWRRRVIENPCALVGVRWAHRRQSGCGTVLR